MRELLDFLETCLRVKTPGQDTVYVFKRARKSKHTISLGRYGPPPKRRELLFLCSDIKPHVPLSPIGLDMDPGTLPVGLSLPQAPTSSLSGPRSRGGPFRGPTPNRCFGPMNLAEVVDRVPDLLPDVLEEMHPSFGASGRATRP